MKKLILLLVCLVSLQAIAQKIVGTVFNAKGDLLPYASITIKGTTIGASANNRAKFGIPVAPGTYTLVCQHIGFITQEKTVRVGQVDEAISFVLDEQKLLMKQIIIKSNGEDPALQIIREAIKKRAFYLNQVNAFTCDLYGKDMVKLHQLPQRILGKKIPSEDRADMGLDSSGKGIIYLSESINKVAIQQPNHYKFQVISSRVSGSSGFGFTFPKFINLYQNNVTVFASQLNPRGFISPIADGALNFYKYKFLGSFWENGREVNSIRVIPKRSYEPLFSGVINITENDWRIHSLDLILSKKAQLEIIDTLQITQLYVPVTEAIWRVKNQLLHFNVNQLGIDLEGNFVNVYANYNVVPSFEKGFFNNVVIQYDSNVNKKPKAYWDSIRPIPLEREEANDYQVKDSVLERKKDELLTQAGVDSLNKKQGKLKWWSIFNDGISRRHYSLTNSFNWGVEPLIKHIAYNAAEGVVLNAMGNYSTYWKRPKLNVRLDPVLRYGFSNRHLNSWMSIQFQKMGSGIDRQINAKYWIIEGGKRVSQYNKESPITPLVNSFSTLLYGDNFMKTYENYFGSLRFVKKYANRLRLTAGALYEDRLPLNNTTNFTIFKKYANSFTPNYPYDRMTAPFLRYQALVAVVDVNFKPGQQYIQFPYDKVAVGSKYPLFNLHFSKGLNGVLGSDVNFDKWSVSATGDKNLKLGGQINYKFEVGGFLNSKSVFIHDYIHFNGNESRVAGDYLNSFQRLSYYGNSTTAPFYALLHTEHHFNGLLTNKIPLFKRFNWNLVAGTNSFYIDQNHNHFEYFVGLENILKILRIDWVSAYDDGGKLHSSGVCIGLGGLLGNAMNNQNALGKTAPEF